MLLFVQSTNRELKLLRAYSGTELCIGLKYSLQLILQNIGLHEDDCLRFEDLVLDDFAFA